jgi:hypothetical protein
LNLRIRSAKNNFTDKIGSTAINSLKLTKIYILTTKSSASASELVINGLKPYMDVVQIGDVTTGKNVGSITLYDSTLEKQQKSNHRYAMQPIVLRIINADGWGLLWWSYSYYSIKRKFGNLGVLGSTTEPLLSTAIGQITGIGKCLNKVLKRF